MTTLQRPLIDAARLLQLEQISLDEGAHQAFEKGVCVMEATAWLANEPFSDHPACVSEFIASLCRSFNDRLKTNEDRDRLLKPIIVDLIGTRTTPEDDEIRAYMATDWLIRQRTPVYLRLGGFVAEAEQLEQLARVADATTARAAREAASEISDRMYTIRNERWSALRASISQKLAAIDAIAASAASAASDASAASAASAAIDAIAASAAIAAIAASAASDAIDAIAASAASDAIAAIDAIDGPQSVHADALRAALAAAKEKTSAWDKRDAAYYAARAVYKQRIGELPIIALIKSEGEKLQVAFVELIRAMCAVGREPAIAQADGVTAG